MNIFVSIISLIGIFLNCFIIFNLNYESNSNHLNSLKVDNVDKILCSDDENFKDNVDNF